VERVEGKGSSRVEKSKNIPRKGEGWTLRLQGREGIMKEQLFLIFASSRKLGFYHEPSTNKICWLWEEKVLTRSISRFWRLEEPE
jgi:hypothetical protein